MALYRLLEKSAFGPDEIKGMTEAYEQALLELGLKDRNDPVTETIARRIIEIAQTGEKDPTTTCTLALQQLRR
jgi:hypothetical protein